MNIVVLCPSRDRPEKAAEMIVSFRNTVELLATELILVVDSDDPKLGGYLTLPDQFNQQSSGPIWPPDPVRIMVLAPEETGNLTAATNTAASRIWNDDCIIGHVGDDHRFQTPGWDRLIIETLDGKIGVAAPNDGGANGLPTACFLSSPIPRRLGWFALPTTRHLYIDNVWREIGLRLDAYHYLPDVRVEHLHPAWGKGEWDAGYEINNAPAMYDHDGSAFTEWIERSAEADVARIQA